MRCYKSTPTRRTLAHVRGDFFYTVVTFQSARQRKVKEEGVILIMMSTKVEETIPYGFSGREFFVRVLVISEMSLGTIRLPSKTLLPAQCPTLFLPLTQFLGSPDCNWILLTVPYQEGASRSIKSVWPKSALVGLLPSYHHHHP